MLKDVSIEVYGGEVLSLTGPNGSGKSTLLRCIEGILRYKGYVFIDNKDIRQMNRNEIAKRIGYVPQYQPQVFPSTVFDTVLMGRYPHASWLPSEHDINIVAQVLELLSISKFALRDIDQLSGGEKQKVFIARTLAQETDILLLDEPTSNLDLRHQLEVLKIIRSLAEERGCAIIVAMHDLNLAARYSDTIVMLKNGSVHAAGKPDVILTEQNIREVYGVEVKIVNNNGEKIIVPLHAV